MQCKTMDQTAQLTAYNACCRVTPLHSAHSLSSLLLTSKSALRTNGLSTIKVETREVVLYWRAINQFFSDTQITAGFNMAREESITSFTR